MSGVFRWAQCSNWNWIWDGFTASLAINYKALWTYTGSKSSFPPPRQPALGYTPQEWPGITYCRVPCSHFTCSEHPQGSGVRKPAAGWETSGTGWRVVSMATAQCHVSPRGTRAGKVTASILKFGELGCPFMFFLFKNSVIK